jgi:pimeloyl-ACP methyl ester carboxylesterase
VTAKSSISKRPRLLLVHGSVVNGEATWAAQRALLERFELVVPNRRGFPPGPDVERVDYEDEAVWLEQFLGPGTHLVGHSYGGVISLFAAARRPELLRSLTVIEPPAFGLARGIPAADDFVDHAVELWERGPREPEAFLRAFLAAVGSSLPSGKPTPALLQGARTLMVERYPWTAEPPLDALARAPFPKLVVSGGHSAAFDAVCDVLEKRLGAERAVLPGAGHSVQRLGAPFNELLAAFVRRSSAADLRAAGDASTDSPA